MTELRKRRLAETQALFREINERLRTLIAAYRTLGGSFTGDLAVDPAHLRDLRRAGGAPPTGLRHEALLYDSPETFVQQTSSFVLAGLAVMVVASFAALAARTKQLLDGLRHAARTAGVRSPLARREVR